MVLAYSYIHPTQEPAHPFLNDYLKQFSTWYPLFGSVACAFFALYLLWCCVHGCLKFGTRCFCIKLHPMKRHGTYLNAMLFNTALVGFCSLPVAEFSAHAFADYAAYADASTRFSTLRRLHFLGSGSRLEEDERRRHDLRVRGPLLHFGAVVLLPAARRARVGPEARESLASSVPRQTGEGGRDDACSRPRTLKKRNETRRARQGVISVYWAAVTVTGHSRGRRSPKSSAG